MKLIFPCGGWAIILFLSIKDWKATLLPNIMPLEDIMDIKLTFDKEIQNIS